MGTLNVQLSVSGQQLNASSSGSGELIATMQGRDTVLGGFEQNLDSLTSNLISQFNQVYASGQGTAAYTSVTSTNSVSDPTAALNQAGLAFTPQNGTFQIEVTNTITGQTTTSTIDVNLNGTGTDTTLNSLASEHQRSRQRLRIGHARRPSPDQRRDELPNPVCQRFEQHAGRLGDQHVLHGKRFDQYRRQFRCDAESAAVRQCTRGRTLGWQQRACALAVRLESRAARSAAKASTVITTRSSRISATKHRPRRPCRPA